MANRGKMLGERNGSEGLVHAATMLAPSHTKRNQAQAHANHIVKLLRELAALQLPIERALRGVKDLEFIKERKRTLRENLALDAYRKELIRLRALERKKHGLIAEANAKRELLNYHPAQRVKESDRALFNKPQKAYLVASNHRDMDLTKE
jgi:hypothetical protein